MCNYVIAFYDKNGDCFDERWSDNYEYVFDFCSTYPNSKHISVKLFELIDGEFYELKV